MKPCSHVDKGVSITSVKKGIKNAGGAAKLGQCQVSENLGPGGVGVGVLLFLPAPVKPCSYVDKGVRITSAKKDIKIAGGAAKLGQCQVSETWARWGGGQWRCYFFLLQ